MRKSIATILILSAAALPLIARAQVTNTTWKVIANMLQPVLASWGVQIPSLASPGSPCVNVNSAGALGTTTCGSGGGTNYFTANGSGIYNNQGGSVQSPSFTATSSTATSTLNGTQVNGQLSVASTSVSILPISQFTGLFSTPDKGADYGQITTNPSVSSGGMDIRYGTDDVGSETDLFLDDNFNNGGAGAALLSTDQGTAQYFFNNGASGNQPSFLISSLYSPWIVLTEYPDVGDMSDYRIFADGNQGIVGRSTGNAYGRNLDIASEPNDTGGNGGNLKLDGGSSVSSSTGKVLLQTVAGGNVGIGTTSPASALAVGGTTTSQGLRDLNYRNSIAVFDQSGNLVPATTSSTVAGSPNTPAGFNASGVPVSTSSPAVAFLTATSTMATSTFAGGVALASSTATTTAKDGFNISAGCYAILGKCLTVGGSTSPGGSNSDVQYNSSGSFDGTNSATLDGSGNLTANSITTTGTDAAGGSIASPSWNVGTGTGVAIDYYGNFEVGSSCSGGNAWVFKESAPGMAQYPILVSCGGFSNPGTALLLMDASNDSVTTWSGSTLDDGNGNMTVVGSFNPEGCLDDSNATSCGSNGQVLSSTGAGTKWLPASALGLGTVTSVGLTVPTGLTVSGSPVTASGTLALALGSGYNIPLTASTSQWATAYASTSNLKATSPITYNSSTGAFGCLSCLISNQLITLSGDVTGSGQMGITTTLATVNSNVGTFTYPSITVNGKGLVTAASNGISTSPNTVAAVNSSGNGIVASSSPAVGYVNATTTVGLATSTIANNLITQGEIYSQKSLLRTEGEAQPYGVGPGFEGGYSTGLGTAYLQGSTRSAAGAFSYNPLLFIGSTLTFNTGNATNHDFTIGSNHNVGLSTTSALTTLDVGGDVTDENQRNCPSVGTDQNGTIKCSSTLATSTASFRNLAATKPVVNTFTPAASTTVEIDVSATVDAVSAGTLTITCTYTNDNNVPSTATFFPMGLTTAGLSTTGSAALSPLVITPMKNTAVTVVATFAGVSVSYDIDATIRPVGSAVN